MFRAASLTIWRQISRNGSSSSSATGRHQADLRRHAAFVRRRSLGVDRRARVAGRPQRLGQIDAAEDRRRSWSSPTRGTRLRAARRHGALSARRSRISPATTRRSAMSRRADARRTITTSRAICSRSLASPALEDPAHLSGGEARRAALARVLAPKPDILLLDEPTNHLDLTTIEWLEKDLDARRTALVLISHDRRFLANLSRSTVWLDRGTTQAPRTGLCPFRGLARHRAGRRRSRDQHKLDRQIVREEHWLRYGVTGTAQAQHAPRRRPAGAARSAPHLSRRRRLGQHHRRCRRRPRARW